MFHLRQTKRLVYPLTAVSLIVATVLPVLQSSTANAAQVQSRSIQISESAASATSVKYHVSFKTATTGSVGGYVLEFCDNSPIIGDTTCGAIAGFNIGAPTVTNQSVGGAGIEDLSTFTTASALTTHTLALSAGSAVAMTSGNVASFDLTSVTNPSTVNHTYYARVYTYGSAGGATGYLLANPSAGAAVVDSGGFALSTAQQVTVTAKVQEQLSFCVYTGANCAAGGSTVNLGDTNGVLAQYNTSYQDASTKFDIATNAQTGAIVNLKMDTLKSGANSIAAQGVACTADSIATNVAQFGVRVSNVGAAPLVATSPYDCAATNHTLDTNNTTGTTSPYGQTVANTTSQPLATTTGTVEFSAKAALTTPAGIYTTTANFIATGTF